MIGHIDRFYVAAQVRLVRQVHKGTILILEGETDARVFGRFIDKSACDIEVAFSKTNVIGALDLLEDEGFPGVIGVVDADFDRILGRTYPVVNLCLTDFHDLNLVIFASTALDHYLAEYADTTPFKALFGSESQAVRKRVVAGCLTLGHCRLSSERRNLRLYFKDLDHEQFVGEDDLVVDADALIATLINRSRTVCTVDNLRTFIAAEVSRAHEPYQLVSGHDVSAVLGIALRKLLGQRREVQTWRREIEAGLRLAFDWEALEGTSVYSCLRAWERNNRPYRIFTV
jgi:hypothetical protein